MKRPILPLAGGCVAGTLVLVASLAAAPPVSSETESADQVWINGNIHTLDGTRPRANALAVRGVKLIAVGSNAEIRKLVGPNTKVTDLHHRTVLPGLIDAHGHVASLGSFGLGRIDLSQARSFSDVVATIATRTEKTAPDTWIVGGRWDHESWPDRTLPTHARLSAASLKNPVWLRRVDGHAGLANTLAMRLAGVTRDTPSPAGGEILRDANGDPTGVFVDTAMDLIEAKVDAPIPDAAELLLKAQGMCLSVGLTGVHDAGISPEEVAVYRRLADDGRLKLRVYALISSAYAEDYFARHGTLVGDRLTVRAAKLYADGAMGSRGAWLLRPYSDRPRDEAGDPYTGLNILTPERMRSLALDGLRRGYQVCTHAIGDRGNRETLDAYAWALEQNPLADHRFRVEHAQLLHPDDIPRFAEVGVVPSMQPTHCTSDMRWVEDRVGAERATGAYAWASLRRTGVPIAAGSDFPVESHNPFLGLYAAITRQNAAGEPAGGWRPEQRMTRTEALRAFTLDAAYAAFEEDRKGSLVPGKLADFIVIDRDILTCPPRDVLETRVLKTVIGGAVVYER